MSPPQYQNLSSALKEIAGRRSVSPTPVSKNQRFDVEHTRADPNEGLTMAAVLQRKLASRQTRMRAQNDASSERADKLSRTPNKGESHVYCNTRSNRV